MPITPQLFDNPIHKGGVRNVGVMPEYRESTNMAKLFYSKRLGPKLREAVEAQLNSNSTRELISCNEELVIIKEMAGQALTYYCTVQEKEVDAAFSQEDKNNLLMTCGQMVTDALTHVVSVSERVSRIIANDKNNVSPAFLQDFTNQLTRIVRECFDHDTEGMIKFDQYLTDHLQLPSIGTEIIGTRLRPCDDVAEMDATVPKAPPAMPAQPSL